MHGDPKVVYECRRCWQRADTPDTIPHNCGPDRIVAIDIPAPRIEVIDPLFKPPEGERGASVPHPGSPED